MEFAHSDFVKYKNNGECPICGKKMLHNVFKNLEWNTACFNGCFSVIFYYHNMTVIVFGEFFEFLRNTKRKEKQNELYKEFIEAIKYWKENDRYLAEILSR